MKDNKKTVIVLVVIIVVIVAIIVYLLLNNTDNNENINTTSVGEEAAVLNAINDENAINSLYKLNDRYANLTTEQIDEMKENRSMDKVSISIKEGTLTKEGTTIIVTDRNDYPYSYGEYFNLQKLENGAWQDVKIIGNHYFNDIVHIIKEDGTTEIGLNWKDMYGELELGHYKLNLEVTQNDYSEATVSTEFDIQ